MILMDVVKASDGRRTLESPGLHDRKGKRRCPALLHVIVICLIWLGAGLVFRRMYFRRRDEFGVQNDWTSDILEVFYEVKDMFESKDGDIAQCIESSQWLRLQEAQPYDGQAPFVFSSDYLSSATAALDIPEPYTSLLFVSDGGQTRGTFDVVPATDLNTPRAEIELRYNDRVDMPQWVSVCLRRTADDGAKIELSTRSRPRQTVDPLQNIRFKVVIKVPSNDSRLHTITEFGTNLPFFAQTVHDLGDAVEFDRLTLQSALAPIHVHAVRTQIANIVTSEADIIGRFEGVSKMNLLSINGDIHADVAVHDNGSVLMETSVGSIHGRINLTSVPDPGVSQSQPKYNVTTRTSHGSTDISFPESVSDAHLHLYVQGTGGTVNVELNPAFKGTFAAWATSFESIHVRTDLADPSGQDRAREYWKNETGERAFEGGVSWGAPTGPSGSVRLRAMSPNVTLVV